MLWPVERIAYATALVITLVYPKYVFVKLRVHQSSNLSTRDRVVNPPTKLTGSESPNCTVDANGEALS